jgi:hypothetical protein
MPRYEEGGRTKRARNDSVEIWRPTLARKRHRVGEERSSGEPQAALGTDYNALIYSPK